MWPHLGRKWASIYVENARVHTPFVTQKNLKEKSEPAESHTTIWKGPKFKFKLYWTHSIETRLLWTRLYYHVESHLCLAEAASGDFYLDLTHFFFFERYRFRQCLCVANYYTVLSANRPTYVYWSDRLFTTVLKDTDELVCGSIFWGHHVASRKSCQMYLVN